MALSFVAVFFAGLLTLVTPCILPMIPVYFALLMGAGVQSISSGSGRFRMVVTTLWFVVGFTAVFVALGMAASTMGSFLASNRPVLLVVAGAAIAIFGAKQLGLLKIPWLDRTLQFSNAHSSHRWLNALLFGFAFALGWTPCVGPILGSVLTFAAASSESAWQGAALLSLYASGIALPMLLFAAAADRLLPLVKSLQKQLPRIERVTGAAMLLVGLLLAVPQLWQGVEQVRSATVATQAKPSNPLRAPAKQPRLVEFYAESCPSCERMAPLVQKLREECRGQGVEVLQVDVSDPNQRLLADGFAVTMVPTLHLLDQEGRSEGVAYGEQDMHELRSLAASLIDAPCSGITPKPAPSSQPKTGCSLSTAPSAGKLKSSGRTEASECSNES